MNRNLIELIPMGVNSILNIRDCVTKQSLVGGDGGQAIIIDMDFGRIVVANSIHFNTARYEYDVNGLLIDPIGTGQAPD